MIQVGQRLRGAGRPKKAVSGRPAEIKVKVRSNDHAVRRQEIERLYISERQHIFDVAKGMSRNHHDAEDLTQDAFLAAMKMSDEGRPLKNPVNWMCSYVRIGVLGEWQRCRTRFGSWGAEGSVSKFVPLTDFVEQEMSQGPRKPIPIYWDDHHSL